MGSGIEFFWNEKNCQKNVKNTEKINLISQENFLIVKTEVKQNVLRRTKNKHREKGI